MKRLMILLSAVVVLIIAILLQLDLIALFKLGLAGTEDAPTTMYFLWIFPTFLNVTYEILKNSVLLIILISDILVLGSGFLFYLGIITEAYPKSRKYHF